jgi:hypothetical protein
MSNLKILEAIINNDPKRIVESIKKALVSKSKDEIRKQIQKESLAYLNEESNIKRIEKHISTKRNSKLLLKFKNGIFRSTIIKKQVSLPISLPNDVSQFIKIWNSSSAQYIDINSISITDENTSTNIRHNNLDLEAYIHITSPIRRIVDLLNMIKFQENHSLIQLSPDALNFYDKWIEEIEHINSTMRDIKKIQNDCSLLDTCYNNPNILEKTYDGFVKYRFLQQQTGKRNIPLTAVAISHMGINTLKWRFPDRVNYFSSRLHYTHQLLLARKFTEGLSVQLSPTLVHKNLVDSASFSNDIWSMGLGVRQKITSRTTLNLEYFYVFPNQMASANTNALSIGFDIETGGHIFQLFLKVIIHFLILSK